MLKQSQSQKQLQKLSPQQLMYVKMLELNTLNFEQRLEEELIENPALEITKDDDDFENEFEEESFPEIEKNENEEFQNDFEEPENTIEKETFEEIDIEDFIEDDSDDYRLNDNNKNEDDDKIYPQIVFSTSFRDTLSEQINSTFEDEDEILIAEQIIGSLDDDGYLRRELQSLVNDLLFQYNHNTTIEKIEKVLFKIQKFEPPGIGARNLQECLLIQIRKKEEKGRNPIIELSKLIITNCFEDFTKRQFEKIANKLNVHIEYLKEAVQLITKLNPKPATVDDETKTETVIPDFVVADNLGNFEIILNQGNQPELKISQDFSDSLKYYDKANTKNNNKEAVQFLKQKIDNAKWFIDAVKQRQNTLLLTMSAIVDIQKEFFKTGDSSKLKPMKLKDIAEKINMDISTISRVATSKYVQTDYGIFLLKYFFSEGIVNEDGEEISTKEVKRLMQETINAEDKKNPMTDDELTELLKTKGYTMARRTVAKYREQLNIPVARLRKSF
ncbi:MAG: RNA polymerase factor sigma-54 [Bacteroidetes bacterium]|nr:RNA polymerase factor sigma-54 [Bacteroidota bacterium]